MTYSAFGVDHGDISKGRERVVGAARLGAEGKFGDPFPAPKARRFRIHTPSDVKMQTALVGTTTAGTLGGYYASGHAKENFKMADKISRNQDRIARNHQEIRRLKKKTVSKARAPRVPATIADSQGLPPGLRRLTRKAKPSDPVHRITDKGTKTKKGKSYDVQAGQIRMPGYTNARFGIHVEPTTSTYAYKDSSPKVQRGLIAAGGVLGAGTGYGGAKYENKAYPKQLKRSEATLRSQKKQISNLKGKS